jgi:hypothetical protein
MNERSYPILDHINQLRSISNHGNNLGERQKRLLDARNGRDDFKKWQALSNRSAITFDEECKNGLKSSRQLF